MVELALRAGREAEGLKVPRGGLSLAQLLLFAADTFPAASEEELVIAPVSPEPIKEPEAADASPINQYPPGTTPHLYERTTTPKRDFRLGVLAAEALEIVCSQPELAYAGAVTRILNGRHGEGYTNGLEIGDALRYLTADGVLTAHEIATPNGRRMQRRMFKPTWKAGFYMGLMGEIAQREAK